jgi:PAS domain S-box-containing protein
MVPKVLIAFFENLSIRLKVLYSTIIMFLLIGILSSIAHWFIFVPSVIEQIQVHSSQVAHSLVNRCRAHILDNDQAMLSSILFEKKEIETDVSYIFVTDAGNSMLAHTFIGSIPMAIETCNPLGPDEEEKVRVVGLRGEDVYDTAVSVREGLRKIGTLHVGMGKRPVDTMACQLGLTLSAVMVVIMALAILLGTIVATYISKPLSRLTRAMNDLSLGKIQRLPRLSRKIRCWQIMGCTEQACPVHQQDNLLCWFVDGTSRCRGKSAEYPAKLEACCYDCKVHRRFGGDEIVQLASAFSNIIHTLELAAREIKASEEKYRLLISYDPNALFVVNLRSGKIEDVNDPAIPMYQYDREELLRMSFLDLFEAGEGERLWKELRQVPGGEYVSVPKLRAMKKDGSCFLIDLHARVGKLEEPEAGDIGCSLIARTVDITSRLEQEAQLAQASKMATLGQMATGIAHELNQPLQVVRMGTDFFAKKIADGERISDQQLLKISRNICEQVDRAAHIIDHLREFSRKSDLSVYPMDLNEPITDVLTLLGQQLKSHNVEVNLKLDEALPRILSDKNRMEQVFLNLVANAKDAMEVKGAAGNKVLTIATCREDGRVVAIVSDTGAGIPKDTLQRIFEPFFTTKEVGKGTGLGLSISYSLVKDFGGDIHVESTPHIGTTFRLSFPIYEEGQPHD